MTETQERFVRMIGERVPIARIAELHLFPPIRQGGVETGIAVIAALPDQATDQTTDQAAPADDAEAAERAILSEDPSRDVGAAPESRPAGERQVEVPVYGEACDLTELAAGLSPDALGPLPADEDAGVQGGRSHREDATAGIFPPPPAAGEWSHNDGRAARSRQAAARHTIYTARYRLTLKGPDRGKWEADVVAEAEAPLITVDAVVRGVQRRAGEVAQPERLTSDAIQAALSGAAWSAET